MVQVGSKIYSFKELFKKKVEKACEFIKRLRKEIIKVIKNEQPPWKFRYIGPYNESDLLMFHIDQILERSGKTRPEIKLFYNQININEEYFSASILFCDTVNIKSFAYRTIQSQKATLYNIMKSVAEPNKEDKIKSDDIDKIKNLYEQVCNLLRKTIDILLIYYKIESRENEIKIENAMVESSKALKDLSSYISDLLMNISQPNKSNSNL